MLKTCTSVRERETDMHLPTPAVLERFLVHTVLRRTQMTHSPNPSKHCLEKYQVSDILYRLDRRESNSTYGLFFNYSSNLKVTIFPNYDFSFFSMGLCDSLVTLRVNTSQQSTTASSIADIYAK